MNKKILVTGGAGYIGSHTVVELINAGYEPVIADDFSNSDHTVIDRIEEITGKRIIFYKVNCADKEAFRKVFTEHKNIAGVIHFAAFKAVGESVQKPLEYYDNNLNSTINLLYLMQEFKIKNLVFSSSCTVYGLPETLPVTEAETLKPAFSPYGNTKRICEEILADTVNANEGLKVISLRYFNPIGAHPTGLLGESPQGIPNNLLPFVAQVASGMRDNLTIFGNDYSTSDGTCIRDYIHVVDLATAHLKALEYFEKMNSGFDVFNVGVGRGISVMEIVNTFEKVTGVKINYKIGPRRSGDIPEMFANAEKANKLLNWKSKYSVEDAIKHTWQFQKKIASMKTKI